ncbi:methyl-accepting chemotaxis protein, partial [Modestobacter roseus]|uniref:methyl-accepting chemotaxis protein n=1 Tax=Modestobacter roseus TaxID=1181884 RepID=UPI0034DE93DF
MSASIPPSPKRSWWGDRHVSTKILTGIGTAALAGTVIGVVGIQALNSAADRTEQIYSNNLTSLSAIAAMQDDVQELRVQSRNAALAVDGAATQQALAAIPEVLTRYEEHRSAYAAATSNSAKRAVLDEADALVDQWSVFSTDVLAPRAVANDYAGWIAANSQNLLLTEATTGLGELAEEERASASTAAAAAREEAEAARLVVLATLIAGVVAAVIVGLVVARGIARGLRRVQDAARALAAGDLTTTVGLTTRDELGQVGAAVDGALAELRSVMASVVASSDAVAAASEELSASSAQISASAEETSAQSNVVSAAAEEVSRNVGTVAAGAEQMGASIREISQNANEAARVAAQAVAEAEATTVTVTKLGDSSREIGEVVKAITSIAEQTNLLALNATIEAARAGDAGKGFAVVANEVKELAQETARATEDIARRVEAIQGDTSGAVAAIGRISEVIGSINDFQLTIASAVEEQT